MKSILAKKVHDQQFVRNIMGVSLVATEYLRSNDMTHDPFRVIKIKNKHRISKIFWLIPFVEIHPWTDACDDDLRYRLPSKTGRDQEVRPVQDQHGAAQEAWAHQAGSVHRHHHRGGGAHASKISHGYPRRWGKKSRLHLMRWDGQLRFLTHLTDYTYGDCV